MKKLIFPALFATFIVGGLLVPFRDKLYWVFAEARPKVETIEEAVISQSQTQATLKDLYLEQKVLADQIKLEQDHQKELNRVQLEALKELVRSIK